MLNVQVPILGFAAASGTGKTTLLSLVIPLLKRHGLRIGLIKHSHHNFDIDQPGKDSFRLREAGANSVMLVSKYRRAIITELDGEQEPSLKSELMAFDQSNLDLILVEGFRHEAFPKIELHRPCLNKPLLYPEDPSIIAVVSDIKLELPNHLPLLDINNPQQIATFIQHFINTYD